MKRMKRISAVLLLAAGFALAFGGCSNTKDETGTEQGGGAGSGDETGGTGGSENPGDSGSSGNQGSGNEGNAGGNGSSGEQTGSGNNSGNTGGTGDSGTSSGGQTGGGTEKPDDNVKVITVFDPATYSGKVGEVVEKDGVKYLKVKPDGYNTTIGDFFDGDGIDLSGKTKFKAVMFGEKANAAVNFAIKLADKDNADISSIYMYQISAEPTEKEAGVAKKESWGNTVSETFLCAKIQPMVQDGEEPYGVRNDTTVYIGKITAE